MDKKRTIFLVFIFAFFSFSAFSQKVPVLAKLKEVAQLPANVPQRVGALAFDGEKLWFAIYLAHGQYVTYDPGSGEWNLDQDPKLRASITKVTGQFASAAGMTFVDRKLWLGSAYGRSFGWIDINDPSKLGVFTKLYKPSLPDTQTYADLAYDGTYLWAAWHVYNYKLDRSKTQLLLKIDKDTGEVLSEYPLPPGNSADGTHALAWDGAKLWHAKGSKLTSIDENGVKMGQFELPALIRPSGMAWDGDSLWIVEFEGKLWKLPFKTIP